MLPMVTKDAGNSCSLVDVQLFAQSIVACDSLVLTKANAGHIEIRPAQLPPFDCPISAAAGCVAASCSMCAGG
jgi:hypothetical protein